MSAFSERRNQDVIKLRELASRSNGRIELIKLLGQPTSEIQLKLNFKTAPNQDYPAKRQDYTAVSIQLSSRYPFEAPTATITTPIFHPNVFSSGRVCLGAKWIPTQGLDLLVEKLVQIVTYDVTILNADSPANSTALSWYRKAVQQFPKDFPTDSSKKTVAQDNSKIKWNDTAQHVSPTVQEARAIIACPSCGSKLRLPLRKKGTVKCPSCKKDFEAVT
jgi:ubiquitin-protein ligase